MPKLTPLETISNLGGNPSSAQNAINENSESITAAFQNTLSRDGSTPNEMLAELDMNSNRIINMADGENPQDGVTVSQLEGVFSSGMLDGDKGDITVSSGASDFSINAGAVTTTELGGDITTAGKALLDDADAAAQRATLGLGTAAQAAFGDFAPVAHTHPSTHITDYLEVFQDTLGQYLIAGNGIQVDYDDTSGQTTVTNINSGNIQDHGLLLGLSDNDHPQYGLLAGGNTWTGWQEFTDGASLGLYSELTGTGASTALALAFYNPSWAANTQYWDLATNAVGTTFSLAAWSDASVEHKALEVMRSGASITSQVYGNVTDLPTHTLHGATTVSAPVASELNVLSTGTGFADTADINLSSQGAAVLSIDAIDDVAHINMTSVWESQMTLVTTGGVSTVRLHGTSGGSLQFWDTDAGVNSGRWKLASLGTLMQFSVQNDAGSSKVAWQVSRTAYAVNTLTFGNTTDNPAFAFVGSGTVAISGALTVAGNTVWNAGNDGAGSGLDADTLDGIEGANYTRLDLTNLGRTGSYSLNAETNTAAEWAALPNGYNSMMDAATIGTAGGAPINSSYGYFTKLGKRDVGGGWGGLWLGYDGGDTYVGQATTDAAFATWSKVWTSSNDGSGSGLDADLLDGVGGDAFVQGDNSTCVRNASTTFTVSDPEHFKAGFWDVNSASWMPDTAAWFWCATFGHNNNTGGTVYNGQLAIKNDTNFKMYGRATNAGTPGSWYEIWSRASSTIGTAKTGGGYVNLITTGDSNFPGYIEFLTGSDLRTAYMGWNDGASSNVINTENGWGMNFMYNGTSRIKYNSTGIGFFAATPIAKPTVTGSKGGNAALTSLCTALANLGLITNSTT